MKARRLRPWVVHTGEFLLALFCALTMMYYFCRIFEGLTGFDPMWLMGLIR